LKEEGRDNMMNINDVISNVEIYGIESAIRGSKYPMATDLSKVNSEVTKTVMKLGTSRQGEGHDNFLNGILIGRLYTQLKNTVLKIGILFFSWVNTRQEKPQH
jgi:hypothetical protein